MTELRLTAPLSWLDGVDPRTGRITQPDHPQRGESIAGRILRLPGSVGSTVGAYTFFKLRRMGTAPSAIVLERPDSITVSAEMAGIPVKVLGAQTNPELDLEGVPDRVRRFLEREASASGAEEFARVRSVHISGISYWTIGEAGLDFLEGMAREASFRVPATLNPAGMDLSRWADMGVPEGFAERQLRIVEALVRMGAIPTLTCTPYLAGNLPRFGEHVCWGESSAVAFANSVLGARTNREGGVKAVAAAVAGVTPLYGLHLRENRSPDLEVEATARVSGRTRFSELGYLVGSLSPSAVPVYRGLGSPSADELKSLGAGGAASGGISIFHVPGVTPESPRPREGADRVTVVDDDLDDVEESLSTTGSEPDLVAIGCPHLSPLEILEVATLLEGRRAAVPFWLFTSRAARAQLPNWVEPALRRAGADLFVDTCMVVAPLREAGHRVVATDSAKAAKYLRTLGGLEVVLAPLDRLISEYTSPA